MRIGAASPKSCAASQSPVEVSNVYLSVDCQVDCVFEAVLDPVVIVELFDGVISFQKMNSRSNAQTGVT